MSFSIPLKGAAVPGGSVSSLLLIRNGHHTVDTLGSRGGCEPCAAAHARSRREVERRVVKLGEFAGPDGLWIAWPKRTSGVSSDLSQTVVREIGLSSGLVDYKICSIDETWSGLRFTPRDRRVRR